MRQSLDACLSLEDLYQRKEVHFLREKNNTHTTGVYLQHISIGCVLKNGAHLQDGAYNQGTVSLCH